MTIKKQFIFLAGLIIAIPILCVLYISVHNYINSPDRLLMNGTKTMRELDKHNISEKDWYELESIIKSLPQNVEFLLISKDGTVLLSKYAELKAGTVLTRSELWKMMEETSQTYFYQYTRINKGTLLVTRTFKNRSDARRKGFPVTSFIIFLFILVLILVTILLTILKNISKSITTLEEQTLAIANGDFSEKIETKNNPRNYNEITSISVSIEKMRLSLVEAQNQKNKFIMGISHDLRTPVAIIKGYTEALKDGVIVENGEIQKSLELISTKTEQLEGMIDTLINFMKLNSTDIRDKLIPQSITQMIKDFAKDSEIAANVFKRHIKTDISLPDNILIPFNKQLITRVFENLFSNALRYTENGDTIKIICYKEDNSIILKVLDTGCGIDEESLDNIFNLFYRGTNSRREEGMGIGLSVVKSIIETHGWQISVTSKVNEGSCFTITIPIT
ncbi:MAG: HAMP domain-containing histidine kinase [Treponema sp.]|nr:HAMP domain-containing histidine kinase [Treponema sp.]